jgi:hypothetical protein
MTSAFSSIKAKVGAASSLFARGYPTGISAVDNLTIKVALSDRTADESYSKIVTHFRRLQTHSATTHNMLAKHDTGLFTTNNQTN